MITKSDKARYSRVRRAFGSMEELGDVINRSRTYVAVRMISGDLDFTHREKLRVLEYLGEPIEKLRNYFPEEGETE